MRVIIETLRGIDAGGFQRPLHPLRQVCRTRLVSGRHIKVSITLREKAWPTKHQLHRAVHIITYRRGWVLQKKWTRNFSPLQWVNFTLITSSLLLSECVVYTWETDTKLHWKINPNKVMDRNPKTPDTRLVEHNSAHLAWYMPIGLPGNPFSTFHVYLSPIRVKTVPNQLGSFRR